MIDLQVIGTFKCSVQYRFITESEVIKKGELIGVGIHEKLLKEFALSKFDVPKDLKKETLNFRNGQIVVNGKTYVIEELDIGNVGMSTSVWGDTAIAIRIIDRTMEIIEESQPQIKLTDLKKMISKQCEMRVKLDVDPHLFMNPQIVLIVKEFCDRMKESEFSKTQVHFPALAVEFVSEPDIEQIVARTKPDEVKTEIEMAVGSKGGRLWCDSAESYQNRIFNVVFQTDSDTTKEILTRIEEALHRA